MEWTFRDEVDAFIKHGAPFVIGGSCASVLGHRQTFEGIPMFIERLCTDVEWFQAWKAIEAEAPAGVQPLDAPFRFIFRLDTLLSQLEHEREEPRELDQPVAVPSPSVVAMAEHQRAYDAMLTSDPTRWPNAD